MRRLYALLAGAILVLGCVHMGMTFRLASATPAGKVWFFGSGLAIALAGAVNLLNRRYGLTAPGLRAVCIGTNVAMAGLTGIAGGLTKASFTARVVMMAVWVSTIILSAVRSASLSPDSGHEHTRKANP